jgi:hypothetical protein
VFVKEGVRDPYVPVWEVVCAQLREALMLSRRKQVFAIKRTVHSFFALRAAAWRTDVGPHPGTIPAGTAFLT